MSKVIVHCYSCYGHLETLAHAISEGARATGAHGDVRRVPRTVPAEVTNAAHFKLDQAAPVATIDELERYDAIVVGTGTRFGRISGQMGHDAVTGGAPYSVTTITGGDGSRQPTANELDSARYLRKRVADTATRLFG